MEPVVKVTVHEYVATVMMDRPPVNAQSDQLRQELIAAFDGFTDRDDVRVAILTGRDRGKDRDDILARLAIGDIDLLVGTHALFQDEVVFKDLALAIVDEQHRFGVHQRLALTQKGDAVDVLAERDVVLRRQPDQHRPVAIHVGARPVAMRLAAPGGVKLVVVRRGKALAVTDHVAE